MHNLTGQTYHNDAGGALLIRQMKSFVDERKNKTI